ncbi:MAG: histidine kinase [Halorhodospira halophila]|uniref:histidine kinase n=1 Tax=Halorhodospira halophila TaxID=1053 RepID=UPI0019134B5C|nr:histidine kinase [Halorhodospira halophila]MCC3750854.1 histidine kinase [Halorhodospira halophila]
MLRTWLGLILLFAVAIIGTLLWYAVEPAGVIEQRLAQLEGVLILWRLGLIAAVVAAWPCAVEFLGNHLTPHQRLLLHDARWQVALWLLVLEALLGQDLIPRLVRLL